MNNAARKFHRIAAFVLAAAALAASLPASAATCENGHIHQAIKEVTGREPRAAECNALRWGCWQSYGELRWRVYRELGSPTGPRPATQKLLRTPGDRASCPAVAAPAGRASSRHSAKNADARAAGGDPAANRPTMS